jgi:hypothetical protein
LYATQSIAIFVAGSKPFLYPFHQSNADKGREKTFAILLHLFILPLQLYARLGNQPQETIYETSSLNLGQLGSICLKSQMVGRPSHWRRDKKILLKMLNNELN